MEVIVLIIAILGLIPVYFLIKEKLRKRYMFDIDYRNILLATLSDSNNSKLNGRICFIIYYLRVINGSDEPSTLKSINLIYQYEGKQFQDESYVVPTGILPKTGEPALVLTNRLDNIVLVGWYNIRSKLGKDEIIPPGGVFSGSAVYLFDSHVTNIHSIQELSLIVSDYYGNKSMQPMVIKKEWIKSLSGGFLIINKSFTFKADGSIQWVK